MKSAIGNYLNQSKILEKSLCKTLRRSAFSKDVGYNFTKTWTPWSVFCNDFTKILRTPFSIVNLYDSLSEVLVFRYKDMLFDAILTLEG